MEMFPNASQLVIEGENCFNNVRGGQFNQTFNLNLVNGMSVKCTEYDEFVDVKRGNLITLKKHSSVDMREWEVGEDEESLRHEISARKSVYKVKVHGVQSEFTAVIYEGEDARTFWKRDFQYFSRTQDPRWVQLFGLNQSSIPALIFHHELIPLGQFYKANSFWKDVYISHLVACDDADVTTHNGTAPRSRPGQGIRSDCLWLDTRGFLCNGPTGSYTPVVPDVIEPIAVPPTADMLSEETTFGYFLNNHGPQMDSFILGLAEFLQYRSDTRIHIDSGQIQEVCTVFGKRFHETLPGLASLCRDAHPVDIMGQLRFDTIYQDSLQEVAHWPRGSGSWGWHCWFNGSALPQTVLEGGLTRFDLDTKLNEGQSIHVEAQFESNMSLVWSAQASRVTGNEEHCYIIRPPVLVLKSGKISCEEEAALDDTVRPLYLFVYRPPSTISELIEWKDGHTHYWSFDRMGRSKLQNLPAEEHPQHELPYLKVVSDGFDDISLYSWPMYLYEAIRNWQVARGFDPTTADFARHMDYPELEIIGPGKKEERPEEIVQAPTPFHQLGLENFIPVNEQGIVLFPVIEDPENESSKKLRVIYSDFMKAVWYQAGYTGPVRYNSIEKSPADYYDVSLLPTHLRIQDPATKGGWVLDLVAHFATNFSARSNQVFALKPAGMQDQIDEEEELAEAAEDERGKDGMDYAVQASWMSTSSHEKRGAAIMRFWQRKGSGKKKKR